MNTYHMTPNLVGKRNHHWIHYTKLLSFQWLLKFQGSLNWWVLWREFTQTSCH